MQSASACRRLIEPSSTLSHPPEGKNEQKYLHTSYTSQSNDSIHVHNLSRSLCLLLTISDRFRALPEKLISGRIGSWILVCCVGWTWTALLPHFAPYRTYSTTRPVGLAWVARQVVIRDLTSWPTPLVRLRRATRDPDLTYPICQSGIRSAFSKTADPELTVSY